MHSNFTGGYVQQMLPVLMGAVAFVLLLACVNVLNLMLARAAGREREIATRASLGAGPLRLFRQLMAESLVLAVCAGSLAAVIASLATALLRQWLPEYVLRRDQITVDTRVLLFTAAITLLASLLAGVLPAWRGSRVSISRFLQSGRSAGARPRSRRLFRSDGHSAPARPLVQPARRYGAPAVALINEAAAEKYWPGENPIGQRIVRAGTEKREMQIVGVVASVRRADVNREATPAYYISQAQTPSTLVEIVVRARDGVHPGELVSAVRKQMASVHSSIAADSIQVMSEVVAGRLARQRFMASFMGVFGGMALLLTASGIFAVMAYSVRMRTHEMAVRLALGAHPSDILRLVIGRGAVWTTAGLLIGLTAALAAARLLESFLYGIQPHDPVTFAVAGAVLACTAIVAAWAPSRQASRVDPAETLRLD
jgi:ABC-type antimicrobial peptide transport system permease subunit